MSRRPPSWRRADAALALAFALVAGAAPADPATGSPARRIVAVGDIHGALDSAREILREVGLIDERDQWIGGGATLVQTGDFLDRGPDATRVAALLMDLQRQAPKQGGEVIVLLGNHEIMNLLGDLRDVTQYILRHHVDKRSEKRLTASCGDYAVYHRRLAELRGEEPPARRELVDRCLAEVPLGLVEYLDEIGPRGDLGRWLRRLPTTAKVDGTLFVHGGFSPAMAGTDLEQIDRETRREIRSFDFTRQHLIDRGLILRTAGLAEVVTTARQVAQATAEAPKLPRLDADFLHVLQFQSWMLVREDGPFWFRGYARWSEEEGGAEIGPILDKLGAERVVVGHTPQPPFVIRQRFDARVFLIDTGMLTSFYKGKPSALVIEDGNITATYLSRDDRLVEAGTAAAD